jgi:hypothetical protein
MTCCHTVIQIIGSLQREYTSISSTKTMWLEMTTFSMSLTKCWVLPQSHYSSHHVSEAKCPPWPTHLWLLQRVDNTEYLVSWKWPDGILLVFSLLIQTRISKNTCTSTVPIAETPWSMWHYFTHSPCLWHELRLANCMYPWSQRLCGITRTMLCLNMHIFRCLLFSPYMP